MRHVVRVGTVGLLAAAAVPLAALEVSTLMGSETAGKKVEVSCGDGRVLVGVTGRAGMWLDNLFLICARVNGAVLSDIKTLNYGWQRIGGLGTYLSKEYNVRCPGGQVVKGLMVHRGSYIHQVGIYCRGWDGTRWTGSGNLHGPVGGSGGSFDARNCTNPTEPVKGLHGRHGTYIDALGIVCDAP